MFLGVSLGRPEEGSCNATHGRAIEGPDMEEPTSHLDYNNLFWSDEEYSGCEKGGVFAHFDWG